jgi:hypothetical protein
MLLAVTACQLPESPKRAVVRALTTFVLESAIDLQGRTALTQSSVRPALQTIPSARPAAHSAKVCTKALPRVKALVARCPLAISTARPSPTS